MKTAKQDRQGVRTFAEVMGFATDAQKDASQAKEEAEEVSEKMNPEEIFRLLTNDGKSQGLYRGDDGNLYVNGEYIKAGTFTSTAEVYINPGVDEFETVKNHILQKETIPANRIALYDTDGSGNITITDMLAFKAAMLGKETIANWPNAVKTNITVTVDAKNIEKTVKISGTNMWGRHIEFYIGLNGGNIGRHDGNLAVNGILSINGDITLRADGSRSVITGLTDPVEDSDAVNKAYAYRLANRKTFTVPAGGSVTVALPGGGTFLISATDNVRRGCVLLQTLDREIFAPGTALIPLQSWTYSADGLNLTISETDGRYDLKVTVAGIGAGYL